MQASNTLNVQPDQKKQPTNSKNSIPNKMRTLGLTVCNGNYTKQFEQMTKFETYELNIEYIEHYCSTFHIMAEIKKKPALEIFV